MSLGALADASSMSALLGPTNTGKTHRAVERMLEHASGMIGLPLRLLAREIYDRMTTRLGEGAVALMTGEEKRIPPRPRYWVCTTEAMPVDRDVDFVAVDEIQLAAHPQRGHVFTERMLLARGRIETWLLGAETMRPLLAELVPAASVRSHPRLSTLKARAATRLSALPARTAIIAFSVPEVYALADRVRRRRGGAAVVHGALSPRTRNAQVAMFQAGEVDCLVATDAIGMGLNLDISHVAFAELRKFDGREMRALSAAELAQIAGRAGRHCADGTFGTLAPLTLAPGLALDIEMHRFPPLRRVMWRNPELDTGSLDGLLASLKRRPSRRLFELQDHADDYCVLELLAARPEIRSRAAAPDAVALLWEACRIPDFRKLLIEPHAQLCGELYLQLTGRSGRLDQDWLDERVQRLDDTTGSIDELLMRMESIRIWSYVAQRPRWLDDGPHWQERCQAVEDRLSESLHNRLVERFVERRRKHAPARPHSRPTRHVADDSTESTAASRTNPFHKLLGLRLRAEPEAVPALQADDRWLNELADAPHERFAVDAHGRIFATALAPAEDRALLGHFTRGVDLLHPELKLTLAALARAGARARILRRLMAFARDLVEEALGPLRAGRVCSLSPAGRGLVYQLEQGLGTALADQARTQVEGLSEADRLLFAELEVELGHSVIYLPRLLEPAALERRLALCAPFLDRRRPLSPDPAAVSLVRQRAVSSELYVALGYPVFGPRAIRADLAEQSAARLRAAAADGPFDLPSELGAWLGCSRSELVLVARALGFRRGKEGWIAA